MNVKKNDIRSIEINYGNLVSVIFRVFYLYMISYQQLFHNQTWPVFKFIHIFPKLSEI